MPDDSEVVVLPPRALTSTPARESAVRRVRSIDEKKSASAETSIGTSAHPASAKATASGRPRSLWAASIAASAIAASAKATVGADVSLGVGGAAGAVATSAVSGTAPSTAVHAAEDDADLAMALMREYDPNAARLESCQRRALWFVSGDACKLSDTALPKLFERVAKLKDRAENALGWDSTDAMKALRFVRSEAPIIIHFNAEKVMASFVDDTHYRYWSSTLVCVLTRGLCRNQFETGTSGGCLSAEHRQKWEQRLFGGSYDGAHPRARPKYGVLNFTRDPSGIYDTCRQYGDCFLLLKHAVRAHTSPPIPSDAVILYQVRARCTMTECDSGDIAVDMAKNGPARFRMATAEHYAHVMCKYTDAELRAVIRIATARAFDVKRSDGHIANYIPNDGILTHYKEVQIHGPLEFARDVEAVYVHPRYFDMPEFVKRFAAFEQKNGCKIHKLEI